MTNPTNYSTEASASPDRDPGAGEGGADGAGEGGRDRRGEGGGGGGVGGGEALPLSKNYRYCSERD